MLGSVADINGQVYTEGPLTIFSYLYMIFLKRNLLLSSADLGYSRSKLDESGLMRLGVYYPPEVRRGEYWGLGAFLLQYSPFVRLLYY